MPSWIKLRVPAFGQPANTVLRVDSPGQAAQLLNGGFADTAANPGGAPPAVPTPSPGGDMATDAELAAALAGLGAGGPGVQGPAGPKGDTGATGPQGPQGTAGTNATVTDATMAAALGSTTAAVIAGRAELKAAYVPVRAPGISMPDPHALDRWKSARAQHATRLVEVALMGDSTWWGQTPTGDNAGSANNVQVAQLLRALSTAAGYTDGGVGVRGFDSSAGMSGPDNLAPIASSSGFGITAYGTAGNYGLLANKSIKTTAQTANAGAAFTAQGKGTQARLTVAIPPSSYATQATATVSINGAAAAPLALSTQGASTALLQTFVYTGLPGGGAVNTVAVTITGSGTFEATVEWLNATGIVWHAYAQPGQSLGRRWDSSGVQAEPLASAVSLGLWENTAYTPGTSTPFFGSTAGAKRTPSLAVLCLGINDMATATGTTAVTSQVQIMRDNVGVFAESCRSAGVDAVVAIPHLLLSGQTSNVRQFLGEFKTALAVAARAWDLPCIDMQVPLGNYAQGAAQWGGAGPHLNAAAYQAQAAYLWSNLLAL